MAPKRARRGSRAASSRAGDAESVASEEGHEDGAGGAANGAASQREAQAQAITAASGAERRADTSLDSYDDPNHVKILLATDNHVGYMERDAVRGQDSINTFREILMLGKERDVDFILLGGDLFHENRPSRTTMHQVMGALREYTLGDRPISVELLSDPNDGRAEGYTFPAVNYEDGNLNVAIPVFSIHGNHDDPQGVGPEGALSAIDLLSVAGYLNYFGKVELPTADTEAGNATSKAPEQGGLSDVGIRIRPVLLRKGDTKIALFGMGNIKDERMHYELYHNRVRMYRPAEDPDDWFNILTIHQNRVAHNPKTVVPENIFDNSIDLLVWGHEHEQLLEPSVVPEKKYVISQPGSSVATSLCPGEAVEKKVAIVHVTKRDFRMEHITLKTVRPFIMEEVDLDDLVEEAGLRIDEKQKVTKLLKGKIRGLIARAKQEWEDKHASTPASERQEMMLPLIRLRVRYTQHTMGNLVRFGQDFVGSVANPRDLLQFSKKKGDNVSSKNATPAVKFLEPMDDMLSDQSKVSMSELVNTFLKTQTLHVLNPMGLERSVMKFVEKDDKHAIGHFVDKELNATNAGLITANPDERDLDTELGRIRKEKNKAADDERNGAADHEEDDDDERDAPPAKAKEKAGAGASRTGVSRASERRHASLDDSVESDDSMLDDDIFDIAQPTPARTAPSKSTAKTTRGAAASSSRQPATPSGRSRQTLLTFRGNSEDDEGPTRTQQPAPAMSARAAALAGIGGGGGKKSTTRGGKASPAKRTTAPRRAATAGRAAAARRASEEYADDDEDDD